MMNRSPFKALMERTLSAAALTGSTMFFFFVIGIGVWQSLRGAAW